jgi:hypothetical protein
VLTGRHEHLPLDGALQNRHGLWVTQGSTKEHYVRSAKEHLEALRSTKNTNKYSEAQRKPKERLVVTCT